jgi:hypothetical protein
VIAYQRDAAGNVTRLTWPEEAGDGYVATYVYDALSRVTGVCEGADTGGLPLGGYVYDTASRRRSLDRHTGAVTRWVWRPDGLVQGLEHGFAAGTPVRFTYLYNREGGVSARLLNDASYQATPALQASTGYTTNALNQYTSVGAASLSYDANGNLKLPLGSVVGIPPTLCGWRAIAASANAGSLTVPAFSARPHASA